jgi:hypothetical protein
MKTNFTAVTTALIQKHFQYTPFIKQGTQNLPGTHYLANVPATDQSEEVYGH